VYVELEEMMRGCAAEFERSACSCHWKLTRRSWTAVGTAE
jgi:hypothetical protein